MLPESRLTRLLVLLGMLSPMIVDTAANTAWGDPCGMVPPISVDREIPQLVRQGLQQTYVFYKNGIETFVIRPGYRGNAAEFGMLVPFPTPPAIRKVPDAVFKHLAAAIDPPEIEIDLRPAPRFGGFGGGMGGGGFFGGGGGFGGSLGFQAEPDSVKVLREEAVGMYEVVVLQAGSAKALKNWMRDHKYRFPDGMEPVCQEYVKRRWCFVAVRTRVGSHKSVQPKPGMRSVNNRLPQGAEFDGHVQAMGFRFRSRRLEVPMRLSVHNGSNLRNIIYVLHDEPLAVNSTSPMFVVRQIPGPQLMANMTQLLPIRVRGAKLLNGRIVVPKRVLAAYKKRRDPEPVNGVARSLIASDLLAVRHNRLNHPLEEQAKSLLAINERLGLRGQQMDNLIDKVSIELQLKNEPRPLAYLKHMTLTVIDGTFPKAVLADANLTFREFQMNRRRNTPNHYHAPTAAPAETPPGMLLRSSTENGHPGARALSQIASAPMPGRSPQAPRRPWSPWTLAGVCAALLCGKWSGRRH